MAHTGKTTDSSPSLMTPHYSGKGSDPHKPQVGHSGGRTFTPTHSDDEGEGDELLPTTRRPGSPQADAPRGTTTMTKADKCRSVAKWAFVAAAVGLAVIGALGLLVYLGKLNIGWQGLGTISTQMGLYGMLGGLGAAAIITILLTVSSCVNRSHKNAQQQLALRDQERSYDI